MNKICSRSDSDTCYEEKYSRKEVYILNGGANFNRVTKKGLPEMVIFEQNLKMRKLAHRYWGRCSIFKILNSGFLQDI